MPVLLPHEVTTSFAHSIMATKKIHDSHNLTHGGGGLTEGGRSSHEAEGSHSPGFPFSQSATAIPNNQSFPRMLLSPCAASIQDAVLGTNSHGGEK